MKYPISQIVVMTSIFLIGFILGDEFFLLSNADKTMSMLKFYGISVSHGSWHVSYSFIHWICSY